MYYLYNHNPRSILTSKIFILYYQSAQEQSTENDDKPDIKETVESMDVDETSNDVVSKDIADKTNNDEENKKESVVEPPKENDSAAVPVVDSSITEERAKTPVKNDVAPKEDAIETPKAEIHPSPVKDSPVKRPIEEAAIPDAAKEPAEVNEKANDYSHVNNVSDEAVVKENKTEENDDAPSSE